MARRPRGARKRVRGGADAPCPAGEGADRGRVVTILCVLDFTGPDETIRLSSLHPGVSVDDVVQNTGFELAIPEDVAESRLPTDEELALIREVLDPRSIRDAEVRA